MQQRGYNDAVTSNKNDVAERFAYNGVEQEQVLGINLYEMVLRQYDPSIARWTGIDPVVHHSYSTYNAFDNNPVFWADPSGADGEHYNWDTQRYEDDQGNEVSFETALASVGANADGSPQDDITVNSEGIVVDVVKNKKPDRFFDENGNELFFNDIEVDTSTRDGWERGDRLFYNISNKELAGAILNAGGRINSKFIFYNPGLAYFITGYKSRGVADFTMSHLVPNYFTQSQKSYLEEGGVFRTTYNTSEHIFRFEGGNTLYNLYDAGNYIWGAWMRVNAFQSWEVEFGSKAHSFFSLDGIDTDADQRAITNGFNHFNFLSND